MVPNKHGRHTATRRTVTTPLIAFLAVVVLAIGGWALLGRGSGDPTAPVALTAEPSSTRGADTSGQSDRGTRATGRGAAAPAIRGLYPAPVTTTTSAPTPVPPTTSARPVPGGPTRTTVAPAPTTTASSAPVPPGSTSYATEVTRLTNVERGKAGCAAVKTDARLAAAALGHSTDMVDRDYFDHTSPDGTGPGDRATAAGYPSWSGENIAAGYPTPAAVVQGWMDSPGHKANILNCRSKATGVGYDARKNMWTRMFGSA